MRHRISKNRDVCDIGNVASEGASSHKCVRAWSWQKVSDRESRTLRICLYFKVMTGIHMLSWTTSQLPCSSHSKLSAQRTARQWVWDGLHPASACSEDTAKTRTWGCPQHSLSSSSSHLKNSRARLSLQCLHFCVCEGNWINLSLAATSSTWLWAV